MDEKAEVKADILTCDNQAISKNKKTTSNR